MTRKTRTDAQATREQLLDAAEEAFLENGLARTSLEAIARRASLTRGAVYWHFRDKADLFEAMLDRVRPPLEDVAEQLETDHGDDPLEAVRRLCRQSLERLAADPRHQRVYTILLHGCERVCTEDSAILRQDESASAFLRLLEVHFARAAELGILNRALSPHAAAWGLHAFMAGVFSQYLRDPEACDIGRHADELVTAFFDGIRQRG